MSRTAPRLGAFHKLIGALLLASVTLLPSPAFAQGGTVRGVARDDSGAVMPGVTISATSTVTGLPRTTETAGDGTFTIAGLPPSGEYTMRAERRGFIPDVREHVAVTAGDTQQVDFILKLSAAETVDVTGTLSSGIDDRFTVQQTIDDRLVHALPLSGRQFVEATAVAAGFTGSADFPSAQGQLYWTNNVLVDGVSSFSKWRGAARGFYSGYGLESIDQVRVLTNTFSAVVGDALASVTTVVTRSGTDEWHGSALLFARGSAFDARPVFAAATPPGNAQQFGLSFGGPIALSRTHVFGSYEGHRTRSRNVVTSPMVRNEEGADRQDEHTAFVRIDHAVSNRQIATARYNGQFFGWHYEPGGLTLPGSGTQFTNRAHSLLVSDRLQASGRLLNDGRLQFSRFVDMRRDLRPSVFISRAGYSVEGGSFGPFGLGTNPERSLEATDTLSYWLGAHALQFGGSTRFVAAHDTALPFGRGAYFFAGPPEVFPEPFLYMQSVPRDEGSAMADPRSRSAAAFLQDDWRVRPGLSINAGLRYDVERVSNIRDYSSPTDWNNIQPRIGAAWAPGATGDFVVRGGVGIYTQQHLLSAIERVQTGGADGAIAVALSPGSPLFPAFPASLGTLPAAVIAWPARDIYRTERALNNPYSVQTSIGVQRLLFRNLVAADFVTLHGRDLLSLVDVNAPASIQKPAQRTVAEADETRAIEAGPGSYRKLITLGNRGLSWYRALQVKVDRASPAFDLVASYTWARARDMANYQLPEDSRNLEAEQARASTDIAHNVSGAFTWQPVASRRLLRDWSVSGVAIVRTNRPYTISWGDDRNGTTQNDARPDGRNGGRTGAYRTVDIALARVFHHGGTSTEARVEAFNALNATNYDQYVGELLSPLFGRPISAFPPRRLQLAVVVRF